MWAQPVSKSWLRGCPPKEMTGMLADWGGPSGVSWVWVDPLYLPAWLLPQQMVPNVSGWRWLRDVSPVLTSSLPELETLICMGAVKQCFCLVCCRPGGCRIGAGIVGQLCLKWCWKGIREKAWGRGDTSEGCLECVGWESPLDLLDAGKVSSL